jgi:GNAT superfamily N-acetyltransferase
MDTQFASALTDQVQSRAADTAIDPEPPCGAKDVVGASAVTWHFAVSGARVAVSADVQAPATRAARSAKRDDRRERISPSLARPDAGCSPTPRAAELSRLRPRCTIAAASVAYHITQYELEQGALEIQYIEEFFGEFPRKKTAAEIVRRLEDRAHLILLANAPLPDDPGTVVPVSFKVSHEIRVPEREPKLADLVERLRDHVRFDGRRVLYSWIGGTRRDWRGQGFFRALTEQQEAWAIEQGFDEIVVKTKNKFYDMRGTLDHLRFEVVKYERHPGDNAESKVYLSKKLLPETLRAHRSAKMVVQIPT